MSTPHPTRSRRTLLLLVVGGLLGLLVAAGIGFAAGSASGDDDAADAVAAADAKACRVAAATTVRVEQAVNPLMTAGRFDAVDRTMELAGTDDIEAIAESVDVDEDVADAFAELSASYLTIVTYANSRADEASYNTNEVRLLLARADRAAGEIEQICES
ncbi:MAG: hypothetical protein WBP61_01015 [Nocardioides sp.]